jgi:hypothetical protein
MEFMADRFATQFEIGGSLKRKKLEEFISILQSDGFGLNYEDATAEAMTAEAERCSKEGEPLIVSALEIAWGDVDSTQEFCQKHKLPFIKRVDGKFEYNGDITWWQPGLRRPETWEDTDKEANKVMISLEALRKKRRSRKTLAQVIKELEKVAPPTGNFQITI